MFKFIRKLLQYSLLLLLVLLLGFFLFNKAYNKNSWFDEAPEKLKYDFTSYLTKIKGHQKLQVGEINQIETIEQTSESRTFYNLMKLPDVVVAVSVPVKYTYFVNMEKEWSFEFTKTPSLSSSDFLSSKFLSSKFLNSKPQAPELLIVHCPPLEVNTPAADISALKFEVKKGGFFANEKSAIENLKGELSYFLLRKGVEHKNLVRETSRTEIKKFVSLWLMEKFSSNSETQIQVTFDDENRTENLNENKNTDLLLNNETQKQNF